MKINTYLNQQSDVHDFMMSEKFLESCQNLLKLREKFLGTNRLALNLNACVCVIQNPESKFD